METRTKNSELILVIFRLLGGEFALPIASVVEILRPQKLTRMPRAPHFVRGVINLRGRVFPVIDLKRRLNLEASPEDARSRFMVVDFHGDQMGLMVDEVKEVYRGLPGDLEAAPSLAKGVTGDYLSGVVCQGDRMILLLDLDRLFVVDEAGAAKGLAA